MRTWGRAVVAAALSLAAVVAAPRIVQAQQPEPAGAPTRPPAVPEGKVVPGARPVTRADSAKQKKERELVKWLPSDSVMDAMMKRPNYRATKYQGDTVIFRAQERTLRLGGVPSAVQRGQTILVGPTITYNDSTQVMQAIGDTVILRDPEHANDDLVASGSIKYNLPESRGVVSNLATSVDNNGAKWQVFGHAAAIINYDDSTAIARGDTASTKRSAFYAQGGTFTSCDEKEAHYHFSSRELKVISKNVMVGRPAVLYIADVPIAWIPFFFQDMRSGRRSGILTPRFGFSEFIRQGSGYRRTVENVGYYFNLGDYLDGQVAIDWRSAANARPGDPGYFTMRGALRYSWLSRFVDGDIAYRTQAQGDGTSLKTYAWRHSQRFSQSSSLSINASYASNTQVLRQTALDPRITLGTIASQANYTRGFGPISFNLGGTQTQYPGRQQIDRSFPTLSLSSRPINVGEWLTWTPSFQTSTQQTINGDQGGGITWRYTPVVSGAVDSTRILQNSRTTNTSFETPLKIFNFNWRNSFRINDQVRDYPQEFILRSVNDTSVRQSRVFARWYESTIDWETGINLPQFGQGKFNLVPSVNLQNVRSGPFAVRSPLTSGGWVNQSKRLVYGLSLSPTIFGLFNGIGPVSRIRHSLTPTLSYSYAPAAQVSDQYLAALNVTRSGDLGSIALNSVSIGLSQNIEIKLRGKPDSLGEPTDGQKLRLLSLQTTGFDYNFNQYSEIKGRREQIGLEPPKWWAGLRTERFGYTLRSDLVPGFDLGMDWSLFQGSTLSDSAVFSPYRESVRLSLSLDPQNPLVAFTKRLLGFGSDSLRGSAPGNGLGGAGQGQGQGQRQASDPFRGASSMMGAATPIQQVIPNGQGWRASLTFSSQRQRPIVGGVQQKVDGRVVCAPFINNPFQYDTCLQNPINNAPSSQVSGVVQGGPIIIPPPVTNLSWNMSFNLTPKWAAQWSTSYDFVAKQFATQSINLQRDMHDWRATFAFSQAPTGNVFFSFFIALKAESALKFNYDRRSSAY